MEAIAHSMQVCGFALNGENARKLGLYFSLRHRLGVAAASLKAAYPGVLSRLDAAASTLSPAERAEILQTGETRSMPRQLAERLAQITERAGIPATDVRMRRPAQVYIIARAIIADLEARS
jgi:hypothetical protein